ncbi:hypothetical protein SEA_SKOG_68 [Gordonia phage Skog]|uniref:Uncharacterized protein n=1 Tax=Gordonia phage Skog TaxID=2704033 RepID=A0A6G6XKC9_9CAUD|nr:hypothetical protein KHQ85_gp068 [Gordonia phage Skog]QIG58220.1 hypothetical protein SEA_SKOG_68 [Gordonia phage Skog]
MSTKIAAIEVLTDARKPEKRRRVTIFIDQIVAIEQREKSGKATVFTTGDQWFYTDEHYDVLVAQINAALSDEDMDEGLLIVKRASPEDRQAILNGDL